MNAQRLPSVLPLKKRAKAMRKASDLSHTQCLRALAEKHGFSSWAALSAASFGQPGPADNASEWQRDSAEVISVRGAA